MIEKWKTMELEGRIYEISNTGKVKSNRRLYIKDNGVEVLSQEKLLKTHLTKKNYVFVNINKSDGTCRRFLVHRLVAMCFVPGRTKDNNQVNHKDGNKSNNYANNLEWVTDEQNKKHARENYLYIQGEEHPFSKLTKEEVIEIRKLYDSGTSQAELRRIYKQLSGACIFNIVHRNSWKSLEWEEE